MHYSNMQNERPCTFISGKVCILGSIKVRIQTLPEINVHARLFGTLEYSGGGQREGNFSSIDQCVILCAFALAGLAF